MGSMTNDREPGFLFHSTLQLLHLAPLWKYTKHTENKNIKVHMQGPAGRNSTPDFLTSVSTGSLLSW